MAKNHVGVIGLGYVGLPLALLAKKKGYQVTGIDNDENRVLSINNGKSPFFDKNIDLNLKSHQIFASTDYSRLAEANIIVVCVPTPVDDNYMPDLTIVMSASLAIGTVIKKGQIIIIESTVNPGVCEDIVIPIIESKSGLKCNEDFYVAHCPERINPGDDKWDVNNIPRVLGGSNRKALDLAYDFYVSTISAPVKKMETLKEAEAVKVVENSFRDVNIAFVNELAMSFSKLGIDVVNVIDGAATKPFSFLAHYPGVGVGGHCIPVDPYYLIEYAKSSGFEHRFLSLARDINNGMPSYVADTLLNLVKDKNYQISKITVLVMGLSYKPNVGDLRESPSLKLLSIINKKGIRSIATDPYVESANGYETIRASSKNELMALLSGATIVIIATAHKEYLGLTPSDFSKSGVKIIIDGRNCMNKKAIEDLGIVYRGIGR